jgi:hypothetical protein
VMAARKRRVAEAGAMAAINKPVHWRSRAAEALTAAEQMISPETKAIMLSIAAGYEKMAQQADKYEEALRALGPPIPKPF